MAVLAAFCIEFVNSYTVQYMYGVGGIRSCCLVLLCFMLAVLAVVLFRVCLQYFMYGVGSIISCCVEFLKSYI
jgi:hypothetical protein